MKELGNKLKALRGNRSLEEMAGITGISRETLRKLENGQNVSLKSLRIITRGVKSLPEDELELIATWLRATAGSAAKHLRIEPIDAKRSRLATIGRDTARALQDKFTALSTKEQTAILTAMQRPPVLRSLIHLNHLYDEVRNGKGA
jgi:transcriptional regulator with XRE-family HTH domain